MMILADTKAFDQHKIMKSTNQVIEVTTRAKEVFLFFFFFKVLGPLKDLIHIENIFLLSFCKQCYEN